MKRILSVENMRESDAATIRKGIPGRELMYRAGRSILEETLKRFEVKGPVGILAGSGNNAGDGYVLALLLHEREIPCNILRCDDRFSPDGEFYCSMCRDRKIPEERITAETLELSSFELVYDCVYGTGFHGEVKPEMAGIFQKVNEERKRGLKVISVDINSGLNGKNGMAGTCVESDLTVSVGDFQPGHFLNMAKDIMKSKVNCPIGIEPVEKPYRLIEEEDNRECFPERKNFSNKGTYGYTALIGGSAKYSGAIRLAALADAAMRSGAGVVSVAVPAALAQTVASQVLESTLWPLPDRDGEMVFSEEEMEKLIKGRRTMAFGMGIGKTEETKKILDFLLRQYEGTLIVDADGLNCLAEMMQEGEAFCLSDAKPQLILTPHLKEFSRLTGKTVAEIEEDPVDMARSFAKDEQVILLLKGPATLVTDGEEVCFVDRGCPGMATAGSGDVLSGILAAVCGYNGDQLLRAVCAGAWINGTAGELAEEEMGAVSMTAGDTVRKIPEVIKNLTDRKDD